MQSDAPFLDLSSCVLVALILAALLVPCLCVCVVLSWYVLSRPEGNMPFKKFQQKALKAS